MKTTGHHEFGDVRSHGFIVSCLFFLMSFGVSQAEIDNAALLYYQALSECPNSAPFSPAERDAIRSGNGSSDILRRVADEHRTVIRLVETGSLISHSDWNVPSYGRIEYGSIWELRLRKLAEIVDADARLLAATGDEKGAFKRCLTLRQMALHMGDDPDLGFYAMVYYRYALKSVKRILGQVPVDVQLLAWLNDRLAIRPRTVNWMMSYMEMTFKFEFDQLPQFMGTVGGLRNIRTVRPNDGSAAYKTKKKAWDDLDDGELIRLVKERYIPFQKEVRNILAGFEPPYEQADMRLHKLIDAMHEESKDDPLLVTWLLEPRALCRARDLFIEIQTEINALNTALEVYLIQAQTGRLPKALPLDSPINPYNNEDFRYKLTDDGFALCLKRPYSPRAVSRRDRTIEYEVHGASASRGLHMSEKKTPGPQNRPVYSDPRLDLYRKLMRNGRREE